MGSFTPSGVEFVAKGLSGYLGDLAKADKAQQDLGKSASSIGGHFASAKSGVASFSQTVGSSSSTLGSFVSSLGSMATVAGGIVTAQLFNKIAEGVGAFVSVGLDAVGEAQKLEAGLGALLTANNLYERSTKEVSVAVGDFSKLQADAAKKSDDLAFKQRELTAEINTQNASIQEQRQRIIQMADGLDKNQQIARLQEMEIALEGMTRELGETATEQGKLNNLTQEYTTVSKTSFEQVMSFADAQAEAKKQTQDLLAFVDKLSIISPFEADQVALVTKFAVGAGLGADATKRFTVGFLDMAAAVGIGSENLAFASGQLLQVAKIGRIGEVDLRQLRNLGIDLEKIIGVEMGLSIEQFNDKAKKSPEIFNELFDAVANFSKNTFPGAAAAMATSLGGLQSTFTDIFRVSSKNLLRPIVEALSPMASTILGNLASIATGPELSQIGQQMGQRMAEGIGTIQESITKIMGGFSRFGVRGGAVSLMGILGFSQESISQVTSVVDTVLAEVGRIQTAFSQFGLSGAAFSIGSLLGLDSDTMITIQETISAIIETVTNLATQVGEVLAGVSFEEWAGGVGRDSGCTGGRGLSLSYCGNRGGYCLYPYPR